MTNKDYFKKVKLLKKKSKKEVSGYYFDGKKSYTLYKDKDGNASEKKVKKQLKIEKKPKYTTGQMCHTIKIIDFKHLFL